MTERKKPRVMWLLNHGTARKFEVEMLKRIGIKEIFLPKQLPADIGFRSASVDYSEDVNLTIPTDELAILNDQNWYSEPSHEAWKIANRYFDILFFIVHDVNIVKSIAKHYKGIALWRAYGHSKDMSYTKILNSIISNIPRYSIESIKNHLYFAHAYEHLPHIEDDFLNKRAVFLPIGMHDCYINDTWKGSDRKIFFICPDLGFNSYYQSIYNQFVKDFKGLEYTIGGVQAISVADPNVLGYVSKEKHERNMQEMRVMFYHSTEPNHIHYHPFEAIKAGMPLVFMAGGLLDRMGGKNLPGRCKNIKEARRKIERVLNDDWTLIENIRKSQACLLDQIKVENCVGAWQTGFEHLLTSLEKIAKKQSVTINKSKRIAVLLPIEYKGGSFRGAKLLAQAIERGAQQEGQNVEVVFCYLNGYYTDEEFADLPPSIKRRPFDWCILGPEESRRALIYAGFEPILNFQRYLSVEDNVNQLMDCDLLVIVSDRLSLPLIPLKPYITLVYDYLQRYEDIVSPEMDLRYRNAVWFAERVLVTTQFTRNDALQYAGLPDKKVCKVPMLVTAPSSQRRITSNNQKSQYFLWTTNTAVHKNHENAFEALSIYYEKYNGQLKCHVTGVNTDKLTKSESPHLKPLAEIMRQSNKLKKNLRLLGNLSDMNYQLQLEACSFLWHAGRIDNGTFSVVEAAHFGVPSLSSDYPAMREMNEQFKLNLNWMDPYNPEDMATQLKKMEVEESILRLRVPSAKSLSSQSLEKLSAAYWEAVKECL